MIKLHMKKSLLCVLLIIPTLFIFPANLSQTQNINQLYQSNEFVGFLDAVYNALPAAAIEQHFYDLSESLDSEPYDRDVANLVKAHALMLLGKHFTVEEYCKDKNTALQYLQLSEKLLDTITFTNSYLSALATSVMAETAGSYFLLDPTAYIFSYGLDASKLITEALSIDPENTQALLLLANSHFHTPVIFGGSTRKATKTLDNLKEKKSTMYTFQLFTFYELRGLIAAKMKNPEDALSWYNKALSLYPENKYIHELIEELP
ncbi:MAG: tetratricopeptide repeat protein [Bacteroidetes bacterium]|nr:tetratricopeptide repeat protein [Bacteroidota bacterium]